MDSYQVSAEVSQDKRGVDLVSDVLPFGRVWYSQPSAIGNAVGYARFRSRSHERILLMILVFILPLPFPSENLGGHGKKSSAQQTAGSPSFLYLASNLRGASLVTKGERARRRLREALVVVCVLQCIL